MHHSPCSMARTPVSCMLRVKYPFPTQPRLTYQFPTDSYGMFFGESFCSALGASEPQHCSRVLLIPQAAKNSPKSVPYCDHKYAHVIVGHVSYKVPQVCLPTSSHNMSRKHVLQECLRSLSHNNVQVCVCVCACVLRVSPRLPHKSAFRNGPHKLSHRSALQGSCLTNCKRVSRKCPVRVLQKECPVSLLLPKVSRNATRLAYKNVTGGFEKLSKNTGWPPRPASSIFPTLAHMH